jgi:hypothetical protein
MHFCVLLCALRVLCGESSKIRAIRVIRGKVFILLCPSIPRSPANCAAEYLMEAMEAELDPPPLMKAAFRRNAQARQGWKLMPQPLRRQYLIFIFRGRYPETRALYIERTVLDAAQYADRHTGNTTNPDVET